MVVGSNFSIQKLNHIIVDCCILSDRGTSPCTSPCIVWKRRRVL